MAVTFKTYREIIASIQASLDGLQSGLSDFRQGSKIFAIISGFSSALSEAWNELSGLRTGFFVSTAYGQDLDNRLADFGLIRSAGANATGVVQAIIRDGVADVKTIEKGTILTTVDGTSSFEVQYKYTVSPSNAFVPISVVSLAPGSRHNLSAGTLLIDSASRFLDSVVFIVGSSLDTSGSPVGDLANGSDDETDESLRTRFPLYLQGLSKATEPAVKQAILSVSGISAAVISNNDPVPGYITVSILDGSNSFSSEVPEQLKQDIEDALYEWKAAGVGLIIKPVAKRSVSIVCEAYIPLNSDTSAVTWETAIKVAIRNVGASLSLGDPLNISSIIKEGNISGLTNFKVIQPSADVIPLANELIFIKDISVSVKTPNL